MKFHEISRAEISTPGFHHRYDRRCVCVCVSAGPQLATPPPLASSARAPSARAPSARTPSAPPAPPLHLPRPLCTSRASSAPPAPPLHLVRLLCTSRASSAPRAPPLHLPRLPRAFPRLPRLVAERGVRALVAQDFHRLFRYLRTALWSPISVSNQVYSVTRGLACVSTIEKYL